MTSVLRARAKLNLDLAVLGRRDDGYHDVRTTLQAIDLHDLVTLTPAQETTLTISGLPIRNTKDNSILKALAALEQATKKKLPTKIHLHKRIPAGAGMGGASADAATALRGIATLHHVKADLQAIASQLGADVPFFLTGGTAVADQRGDHLSHVPTQKQWFTIAWPGVELSTQDVYRAWDTMPGDMPNQLMNAAFSVEPQLKEFFKSLGPTWQMTGSGSAFFRRCESEQEARDIVAKLNCWTAVAQAIGPWSE